MKKNWYYDLETLHDFFCAVFISSDGDHRIFEISFRKNDIKELLKFLKEECLGLIGYNNLAFDSQIIQYIWYNSKNITAKEISKFAQKVILSKWPIYSEKQILISNLDIYKILHLDNKNRMVSLKWCQFMIDWPNVEDMPIHHTKSINTDEESEMIISYCINDVQSTKALVEKYFKEIELRIKLSQKYQMNLMNASNSKIGSELMLKLYCKRTNKDPQEVRKMRTERSSIDCNTIIFPYIKFAQKPFQDVLEVFKNLKIEPNKEQEEENKTKKKKHITTTIYKGFQYDYGLGGIHGSLLNTIIEAKDDWVIIDADVASLYPSIATVNKLYPEHLGPEFAEVYDEDIVSVRLAEKHKENGDKIIIAGFKEAANSVYGKSNDNYSWLKDYQYTLSTTINGQLMISMLAEKLMEIPESQLIQINTDGLTVKLKKEYESLYYQLCKEWEEITRLTLEYAYYKKMIVRDVNNYIAIYSNGKTKCKGAFEFENLPLHKNKSELIVRKAMFNWFVNDIPVEDTITNATNILDFCIGARVKGDAKFIYLDKNGQEFNLPRTIRYFISNRGIVIKKKYYDGRFEYMNAPPQRGKTWYQTLLNKYEDTDISIYDINYQYYIIQAKNEILKFQPSLKLF